MSILSIFLALGNVFRSIPTAATAASGVVAGSAVLLDHAPTSTLDWVVLAAGAIGMVANVIHANAVVAQKNAQ